MSLAQNRFSLNFKKPIDWVMVQSGKHRILLIILTVYALVAGAYSVINPLYEASDELRHFRFVRVLAETGRLPVQGQEPKRSQSHHPPLYYALSAAATFWIPNQGELYLDRPDNPFWGYRYWEVGTDNKNMYLHGADEAFPWYGAALAAHLSRFVNVVLGTLTVATTAAIMMVIFPNRPFLGYGAAALIAFNPMFLYMSGTINNDVAAALAGAAVTLFCLLLLRDGLTRSRLSALGIGLGLALMAKFNLAYLLVLAEVLIGYRSIAPLRPPVGRPQVTVAVRTFIKANAAVLSLTSVIAAWWFVRNQTLYGDLTGFKAVTELWGVRSPWDSVEIAWLELPNVWSSLWGRFGYGQIPLPAWIYSALAWFSGLGGIGALLGSLRLAKKDKPALCLSQLMVLVLSTLGAFCVLFGYMLVSPAGSMGRFFFPGLPAMVGLIFFGWSELALVLDRVSSLSLRPPCPFLLTSLPMFVLALWALMGILAPAYAVPKALEAAEVPQNLNITLSDADGPLVKLLGYDLNAEMFRPQDQVAITLYWHTLRQAGSNYVVFVHLLDDVGILVAQRDTYPGLGNYVTSAWRPDHVFAETYTLDLPATAYAPTTITPQVGLYSRDWDFRLETSPTVTDHAITLRPVVLESSPGVLVNPMDINFGDQVHLLGYQVSPRVARPGEEITFKLYWQIAQRPDRNYEIFLHILGDDNHIWASDDSALDPSMLQWPLESLVEDVRTLVIPPDMPVGIYPVEMGVWGGTSGGGRLPIIAEDGHWVDERLMLSPIRVTTESFP